MEEQGILLERATFEFSQEGNCLSHRDESESLTIEFEADLGLDRSEGGFYVIKTEKWSVDSTKDLENLFNRINQILIKKK